MAEALLNGEVQMEEDGYRIPAQFLPGQRGDSSVIANGTLVFEGEKTVDYDFSMPAREGKEDAILSYSYALLPKC